MNLQSILLEQYGPIEAKEIEKEMRSEVENIMADGGSYDEVEEYLLDGGFEMDYIIDLL